ncbi:MAG: hypothetical protein IKE43_09235 [Coriobacteriales bacterium]|nr:hypothetical protein [Coriobacteriales bacterium]
MTLFTIEQLEQIEGYLAQERCQDIQPALEGLVHDMELYIDENCETTNSKQYFSFATQFEHLTYKRVEDDPRELELVPVPFDRAYADYAFCCIQLDDLENAAEMLKKAIRWNPMNCAHRLDLASVMARLGDYEQFLKLTYSVFSRASHASHLVRAYLNFSDYFIACTQYETAAACIKAALRLSPEDMRANNAATKLVVEHQCDPKAQTDELCTSLLEAEGLPEGANVEIVLSALLLADLAGGQGDLKTCQEMAKIAVELVGQKKAMALAQIIKEQGEEQFPDVDEADLIAATGLYASPEASATLEAASRIAADPEKQAEAAARAEVPVSAQQAQVPSKPKSMEELTPEEAEARKARAKEYARLMEQVRKDAKATPHNSPTGHAF